MLSYLIAAVLFFSPTLEEKVGQILMVHFNGRECNEDAARLIEEAHVGGFIYYNWANELSSPEQVKRLSESLQSKSPRPLLIAVDQEGGRICRLSQGFSHPPAAHVLGKSGNPEEAFQWAFLSGQELARVGVNLNLAPVADVNSNPLNPVINDRSYGETPERVITYAGEALKGYKKAGILPTLKHYPGHGDVSVDSHLDLPLIDKSLEKLERTELKPFAALASETPAILTAHLLVPALDSEAPVTFSKPALDYLRDTLGFKGLILSDSLAMEGILKQASSLEETVFKAFLAGHDILLLGGKQLVGENVGFEITPDDVIRIHRFLVEKIRGNSLLEEQLNRSVERIRCLLSE